MKNEWPASFLLSSRLRSRKSSLGPKFRLVFIREGGPPQEAVLRPRCTAKHGGFRENKPFECALYGSGSVRVLPNRAELRWARCDPLLPIVPTEVERLVSDMDRSWNHGCIGQPGDRNSPGSPALEISGMRRCIRGRRGCHPSTSVVAKSRLDQCRNGGAFASTMKCVRDSTA
jgi:hypothetical protein